MIGKKMLTDYDDLQNILKSAEFSINTIEDKDIAFCTGFPSRKVFFILYLSLATQVTIVKTSDTTTSKIMVKVKSVLREEKKTLPRERIICFCLAQG